MKKLFWLFLLVPVIAFARTSYWGEYEGEVIRSLTNPTRTADDITLVLSQAVDEIANDVKWIGTRKEAHDLFRNFLSIEVGIIPPDNWDADVTEVQDVSVDFMKFLDDVELNNRRLTQASKDDILAAARTLAVLEDIP